jgi:hypothetical protein
VNHLACDAGKPVEVTVLGGSISTGAVASRKQATVDPNDLWSMVRIYMQQNIDGSITFNNNARSATKSYITRYDCPLTVGSTWLSNHMLASGLVSLTHPIMPGIDATQ